MRGKPNTGVSQEKVLPQVGQGLPALASGVLTSLPVMFGATSELLHHFRLEGKLRGDARHAPDPFMAYMRPLFHSPLRVHKQLCLSLAFRVSKVARNSRAPGSSCQREQVPSGWRKSAGAAHSPRRSCP